MNKTVPILSLTTSPSDYSCKDGELAMCHNMVHKNGELTPMFEPKELFRFVGEASDVILRYIHKSSNGDILVVSDSTGELFSCKFVEGKTEYTTDDLVDIRMPMDSSDPLEPKRILAKSFSAIGDIMIVGYENGATYYYRAYYGDEYVMLGDGLPELPKIQFTFRTIYKDRLNFSWPYELAHTDNIDSVDIKIQISEGGRIGSEEDAELFYNTAMGIVNQRHKAVKSDNVFDLPFLLRYAYRLTDGSHFKMSAPILMIPNSGAIAPLVAYTGGGGESGVHMQCPSIASILFYRITKGVQLDEWEDVIEGIDIFVSSPIYTYDEATTAKEWFDISSGGSGRSFERPRTNPKNRIWYGNTYGQLTPAQVNSVTKNILSLDPIGKSDLNALFAEEIWPESESEKKEFFRMPWKSLEEVRNSIANITSFYHIATLNTGVVEMEDFTHLAIEPGALSALETRTALVEDYLANYTTLSSNTLVYNNRLLKAGTYRDYTSSITFGDTQQYQKEESASDLDSYVRLDKSNAEYWQKSGTDKKIAVRSCGVFWPDPGAKKLVVRTATSGNCFGIPLKRHPMLQAAYWLPEWDKDFFEEKNLADLDKVNLPTPSPNVKQVSVGSTVYLSEVNNPFVFPSSYATSVGTGEVKALAVATKAMSEGQFGQHPVYAFTTEGVWAIEITDEGKMKAKQPTKRDVCTNYNAICSIDDAVVYPTLEGLMMISGSSSKCISKALDETCDKMNNDTLPNFGAAITAALGTSISLPSELSFDDLLTTCEIGWNPQQKQMIVAEKGNVFAFVFDIDNASWATMNIGGVLAISRFERFVNNYPSTLMQKADGTVYDLTEVDYSKPKSGVIVTRPIKFGDPDILKTTRTAVVRGRFGNGDVKTVLYGSIDGDEWIYITSSVDNYLRGYSGSPYRYFRLVIIPGKRLEPREGIACIDFDIQPKYTKKLR